MSVFFRRRGEPPATSVAVTITGAGNASHCYATINGTKYYAAASGLNVNSGEKITFYVDVDGGSITIDGEQITDASGGLGGEYTWTVPSGITTITIALTSDNWSQSITVTTS